MFQTNHFVHKTEKLFIFCQNQTSLPKNTTSPKLFDQTTFELFKTKLSFNIVRIVNHQPQ